MAYGTSTLHFFGIDCTTSLSEGIDYCARHHESESDIDDYSGWKTTYYNDSGSTAGNPAKRGKCGSSESEGTGYSCGTYGGWDTKSHQLVGL